MQTKVYHKLFYSIWKKHFPSVYIIDTTCFDECFLFHVITGRHYFLKKFMVTQGLIQPSCCCVLWTSVLKEVRILYPLSPQKHYNAANTNVPKHSFYFLIVLNKIYLSITFFFLSVFSFILWMFYIFLYKGNFQNSKAQKIPRGMFFLLKVVLFMAGYLILEISENKNT